MEAGTSPDQTCGVFARSHEGLDPNQIHRFVVGEDTEPRPMGTAEAEEVLGDPFASLVLLKGKFPRTAVECLAALDEATAQDDVLRQQMTFVLGEGSQIPVRPDNNGLQRSLRFLATRGGTANGPADGPDLLISVGHPEASDVELMAWDRRIGGFNYYRAVPPDATWVFAGNARHALGEATEARGPFESHKAGALLMKELKLPWINWDSPTAQIFPSVFPEDDDRRTHPWFTGKEPGGAYTFELAVAKPVITRWVRVRFGELLADGGAIDRPARIMEQILETPNANLLTSERESASVTPDSQLELPPTFFVDADGLATLGLQGPPQFSVPGAIYLESLNKFEVRLADGQGFEQPGDTHFAFLIPERAFEDQLVLREALRIGLLSRRLAACLLMTDFPNPLFSERRAALMRHVPANATVSNNQSSFSQEMADAIVATAESSEAASPEREFAERWEVGEAFEGPFNQLLGNYYQALGQGLETQAGFDDYVRLAESRRQEARGNPIFREFRLLFAATNVQPSPRSMRPDGTVAG